MRLRAGLGVGLAVVMAGVGALFIALPAPMASAQTAHQKACSNPKVPKWFYDQLARAVRVGSDKVPNTWGHSIDLARIACNESDFRAKAVNNTGKTYGIGQMTKSNISAARVSWQNYWNGGGGKPASYYQILAMARYVQKRYGSPANAWKHEWKYNWY
jgi:hypothetical protein